MENVITKVTPIVSANSFMQINGEYRMISDKEAYSKGLERVPFNKEILVSLGAVNNQFEFNDIKFIYKEKCNCYKCEYNNIPRFYPKHNPCVCLHFVDELQELIVSITGKHLIVKDRIIFRNNLFTCAINDIEADQPVAIFQVKNRIGTLINFNQAFYDFGSDHFTRKVGQKTTLPIKGHHPLKMFDEKLVSQIEKWIKADGLYQDEGCETEHTLYVENKGVGIYNIIKGNLVKVHIIFNAS